MPKKTIRCTRVFVQSPHVSSVAAGILLRRDLRSRCEAGGWKQKLIWRDSVVNKVIAAGLPLTCEFCGMTDLIPFYKDRTQKSLTLDHFIPFSRSKDNRLSNLVISCSPCNSRKSDRLPSEMEIKTIKTIDFLLNNAGQLQTI